MIGHVFLLGAALMQSPMPADANSQLELIVARARARTQADVVNKRDKLLFNRIETTQPLRPDGTVITSSVETFLIYGCGTRICKQLMMVDGRNITAAPEYTEDFLDEKFFDRYEYQFASPIAAVVNDRQCYAITFKPKNKSPYNDTDMDEILNLMTGTIYVDVENSIVWNIQAVMSHNISKLFGIAGVWQFDFAIEQQLFEGIAGGKTVTITVRFKRPFQGKKFERHFIVNTDYRYRDVNPSQ